MKLVDQYTFKARLLPMFVLLLPIALGSIAVLPVASVMSAVFALLGTFSAQTVLTMLFAELGRDAGKKRERYLFQLWGGTPTDMILAGRGSTLERTTVARYKVRLAELIPQMVFPSAEEEQKDPGHARDIFRSCAQFLRERTRDTTTFAILFSENMSYGFRRNLWAMKPAGVVIALAGTAISAMALVAHIDVSYAAVVATVATILNTSLLVWWLIRITPTWVRIPADAYAQALFAAVDRL